MRNFKIIYKPISKYNNFERSTIINISKPSGDIGKDAHSAVNIFCSTIGNLKKYDILEIQELDLNGNPIGESIKPTNDNGMIPISK